MGSLEVALIAICASLISVLMTIMIFVFGFRDRLTRVEESVKSINRSLDSLTAALSTRPVCALHSEFETAGALRQERLERVEEELKELKRK